MGDLRSRIEVTKLAHDLRTSADDLSFLAAHRPEEIRDLRAAVADALFARHEERVRRLASLSGALPVPVTAKIAEHALGPMLSARVAGALEPRAAARLASHLSPEFLAELAVFLDPQRVEGIVHALPEELVVDVSARLLERGELLALSRFVPVVDVALAETIVRGATPAQLLEIALFTEDPGALDAVVERLDDETLGAVLREAAEAGEHDAAVALLSALSPGTSARVITRIRDLQGG